MIPRFVMETTTRTEESSAIYSINEETTEGTSAELK